MILRDFNHGLDISTKKMLSVNLFPDSIFYCEILVDSSHWQILSHHSSENVDFEQLHFLPHDIEQTLQSNGYSRINIQVMSPAASMHKDAEAFKKQFPSLAHKIHYSQNLLSQENQSFFVLSRHQNNFLNNHFGEFEYRIKHFMFSLDAHYYDKKEDIAHCHLDGKKVHLYIKHSNSILYNSFDYHSNEDVLYFINAAYDATKLNPKKLGLNISGWIDQDSALWKMLNGYFIDIQVCNPITLTMFGENKLPTHHFFDHYLNVLCG